jgi:putative membrane protein
VVLAEKPDREIVLGSVTQPWVAAPVFRSVPAAEFRDFGEPGYVKIAWTLRADPTDENRATFHTETRVCTTDTERAATVPQLLVVRGAGRRSDPDGDARPAAPRRREARHADGGIILVVRQGNDDPPSLVHQCRGPWAAVQIVPGVSYTGDWRLLLVVALIFGALNAALKPLLIILTLPFLVITLGLFTFVVNAFLLWMTSALSGALGLGFHVSGFGAAFLGALVVSGVSVLLSIFASHPEKRRATRDA